MVSTAFLSLNLICFCKVKKKIHTAENKQIENPKHPLTKKKPNTQTHQKKPKQKNRISN